MSAYFDCKLSAVHYHPHRSHWRSILETFQRGLDEQGGWRGARKNAPDAHVGAGQVGQLDGARETLVTLGVIVLQADLKLNGLEEVTLLLVEGVLQQLLDILTHAGCECVSECSLVSS